MQKSKKVGTGTGSGTVINYGSYCDFLVRYGSGSASQKVTVPTVPVPVPVPQRCFLIRGCLLSTFLNLSGQVQTKVPMRFKRS